MVKSNSHIESKYRTRTIKASRLINSKVGKIRESKWMQLVKQREEK